MGFFSASLGKNGIGVYGIIAGAIEFLTELLMLENCTWTFGGAARKESSIGLL
jgi:hypothetical protein